MIAFERYKLSNGLTVILHRDMTTPLVFVNMLYRVGSKNEQPQKTGLAHLFEHLMFTGTDMVPDFDHPIQQAGGENNAFTSNDITNYHSSAPAKNLELLLWLEADRMQNLEIDEESFDIQRKVVIEEFYETCIDEPYGDIWHHICGQAYPDHPYQWPVIGRTPEEVAGLTLKDARQFYKTYYTPKNAILVVAGNFETDATKAKVEKWFGSINGQSVKRSFKPSLIEQDDIRRQEVFASVNVPALYMSFNIPPRKGAAFYYNDVLSDILANGRSSRLYRRLVKETQVFSSIDAYTNGVSEAGLLIIEGRPEQGVSLESAEQHVWNILNELRSIPIEKKELDKVVNKTLFSLVVSEYSAQNKAMNLAYYEYLGDVNLINREGMDYRKLNVEGLHHTANVTFRPENANIIYYRPQLTQQ